jgi:hypothetical protein
MPHWTAHQSACIRAGAVLRQLRHTSTKAQHCMHCMKKMCRLMVRIALNAGCVTILDEEIQLKDLI